MKHFILDDDSARFLRDLNEFLRRGWKMVGVVVRNMTQKGVFYSVTLER